MILDQPVYSTRDVAQLIGVDPGAVRAAIHAGTIKAEKFNTYYIIRRDDLADYLDYRERRDNGK